MARKRSEPASLLSGSMRQIARVDRLVMTSGTTQPSCFLRGAAEMEGAEVVVRNSYWLQLGRHGMLRITVTDIDRHPPGRTILHFRVVSALRVAREA